MVVVLVIFMILNLVAPVLRLIFGMHVRMNLTLLCRILTRRIGLFLAWIDSLGPRPAGRGTPRSWGIVLPPTSGTGDKTSKKLVPTLIKPPLFVPRYFGDKLKMGDKWW